MKVELPIEQWSALDQSAVRNIELLMLARQNIAMSAKALEAEEAKAKATSCTQTAVALEQIAEQANAQQQPVETAVGGAPPANTPAA